MLSARSSLVSLKIRLVKYKVKVMSESDRQFSFQFSCTLQIVLTILWVAYLLSVSEVCSMYAFYSKIDLNLAHVMQYWFTSFDVIVTYKSCAIIA